MSRPMRTALLKILEEDRFPGISGRLIGQDKWSLEDDKLRSSDRDFLQTWVDDYADDPAWDKLVADARRFQKSPMFDHVWLIWYALRARRAAEDAGSGVDRLDEERKKRREELLDLVKSADGLAAFWKKAQAKCAVLEPWLPPFPVPREQVLQFQELNRKQAACLRRIAGRPPRITPISRQRRSGKREQTRESGVFMRTMVEFMRKICGKPRNEVVATLANIAFPSADFSTEDVRTAMRSTTRSGRSRKTGALSTKKSDRVPR
jgi:hypothetical protein